MFILVPVLLKVLALQIIILGVGIPARTNTVLSGNKYPLRWMKGEQQLTWQPALFYHCTDFGLASSAVLKAKNWLQLFSYTSQLKLLKVMWGFFSEAALFYWSASCFEEFYYGRKEVEKTCQKTGIMIHDIHLCFTAVIYPGVADFLRVVGRAVCQMAMCKMWHSSLRRSIKLIGKHIADI